MSDNTLNPMESKKDYTYKVKCRGCGKISEMWFGTSDQSNAKDFKLWAVEHSTFPIQKQCSCDNGSILFHDLVSYTIIF